MTERAPTHVVDDLGRKLMADVTGATKRTAALLPNPNDQSLICFLAFGAVLGMCIRFSEHGWGKGLTPEELADLLWQERIRPLVIGVASDESAEQTVRRMRFLPGSECHSETKP